MRFAALALASAASLAAPTSVQAQVTEADLRTLAAKELGASRLRMSARIVVDVARSQGFAAIDFGGGPRALMIYVHPTPMQMYELNTWAFVLGHELAHAVTRRGGTPPSEQEADVIGAGIAVRSGFDLKRYINFLYTLPGGDPAHGTWQERARNLEQKFGVTVGGLRYHSVVKSASTSWFAKTRGENHAGRVRRKVTATGRR
jgi:hypothetical protein